MFGLGTPSGSAELRRHRLFETSFSIPLRPACRHGEGVISVHGGHARDRARRTNSANRDRKRYSVEEAQAALGIDWMTMQGLSQAIPPAYAQFIGNQAIETMSKARKDAAA